MKIIGLTGNIASGKSSVSKILQELGADVLDMDIIGKSIQEVNFENVIESIKKSFGKEVVQENNKLNRKGLSKIVFSNNKALKELNRIMVPPMTHKLLEYIKEKKKEKKKIVVIDAAILFEAGWDTIVDEIWVVYTPENIQKKRLIEREGLTNDEALARIKSQMDIKEKIKKAKYVIDNSKDFEFLKEQVLKLWVKTQKCI